MTSPPATPLSPQASRIREVISAFLQKRLQAKLDETPPDNVTRREFLAQAYLPENWLPAAARRVAQIQQVTHTLKFTHPDARGSNLSVAGNPCAGESLIGTHTIAHCLPYDVAGNAAALDVYQLLRLPVADTGKTLFDLAVAADPDLSAALSEDKAQATDWMSAFAALSQPKGKMSTSQLAKQVYWPMEDGTYHLLSPLYPTSLMHALWQRIRADRFSDEAVAARKARKENVLHPHGFCEYPNLLVQNFGGSKPLNISQLNSERRGESYLLPSLPPVWKSTTAKAPTGVNSIFDRHFGSRPRVRELVRTLQEFLVSVQHVNNVRIRNKRAELAAQISSEVFQLAAELRQLEPGWSDLPDCLLNDDEQCWLDPERALQDEDFARLRERMDWPDEICRRFGNFLNTRLTVKELPMSAVEAAHWRNVLDEEMKMLKLEVSDV